MILKLSRPLYFMRHTNFTRIPHKHTVPAASAATGYLRGISGAWSLLPETCYVGCSRRGAQRAESCSLVARLWKSSSRAPGSLEFHEICNPVIYYLSKDFYVRAHTHVHAWAESWLKEQSEEFGRGAGSAPQADS